MSLLAPTIESANRVCPVTVKFTQNEHRLVTAHANEIGQARSEWVREVILRELTKSKEAPDAGPLLTELVGLRMLVYNVFKALMAGQKMSNETFDALMQHIRREKTQAAIELLTPGWRPLMPTQWGRKETVIWPPHSPIYTYGAMFVAAVLMGFFLYTRFTLGSTPLQRFYTPIYLRASIASEFGKDRQDKYRLLFLTGVEAPPKMPVEADVQDGLTKEQSEKPIALVPSAAALRQGYDVLFRVTQRRSSQDCRLARQS